MHTDSKQAESPRPSPRRVRFPEEDQRVLEAESHDNPLYMQSQLPEPGVEAVTVEVGAAARVDNTGSKAESTPSTSEANAEDTTYPGKLSVFKYRTSAAIGRTPKGPPTPKSLADTHDEYYEFSVSATSYWASWAAAHPWTCRGILALLVLGLCAAAVVPAVCLTVGCRPRSPPPDDTPLSLRVLVRFTDPGVTAKGLVPLLAAYFNSTRLVSSGLEVLDFEDLDVMREVKQLLRARHADKLDLLINDFRMSAWPQLDLLSNTVPQLLNRTGLTDAAVANLTAAAAAAASRAAAAAGGAASDLTSAAQLPAASAGSGSGSAGSRRRSAQEQDARRAGSASSGNGTSSSTAGSGGRSSTAGSGSSSSSTTGSGGSSGSSTTGSSSTGSTGSTGSSSSAGSSSSSTGSSSGSVTDLGDPLLAQQWHLGAIQATQAWATTQGLPDVVVAVLDTGFDLSHPDLAASWWTNKGETPGNGVDDDGNGFVDDVNGYDFAGPCSVDWRSVPPPAARPPASFPPPPPTTTTASQPRPPSPPPPSVKRPARRTMQQLLSALTGAASGAGGTTLGGMDGTAAAAAASATPTLLAEQQAVQATAAEKGASVAAGAAAAAAGGSAAAGGGAAAGTAGGAAAGAAEQIYQPGRCGSDPDPRPGPADTGHGTHVAGLVAAVRGNGKGGSGVAPRVKIMALKVADAYGNFWTSNIVAAYDYALRNGAHIVSCSFGPYAPVLAPTPYDVAQSAAETRVYERAVQPLLQKGVLVVAAAGNEDTNLDRLRDVGMSYLPCTLGLPNVLCVAASGPDGNIWREVAANRWVGSNTGTSTVDIAAPGSRIISTVPGGDPAQGAYDDKTGSSMATPIVSGAAALVVSVLGRTDGNYYQALRVRSLLVETGDFVAGLPVLTQRNLNAARAVAAAAALSGGGATLLVPSSTDVVAASGFLMRGLADTYFRMTPAGRAAMAAAAAAAASPANASSSAPAAGSSGSASGSTSASGSGSGSGSYRLSVLGLQQLGSGVRPASTRLSTFKYTSDDIVVAVRGHLRVPVAGTYGVRLITEAPLARLAVTVGQRLLTWAPVAVGGAATTATVGGGSTTTYGAVLQAPQPGWYDFEVLYGNTSGPALELTWSLPDSPVAFGPLPDGLLGMGSLTLPTPPPYAPTTAAGVVPPPEPGALPCGWQVLWNNFTSPAAAAAADGDDGAGGGSSSGGGGTNGTANSTAAAAAAALRWDAGFLATAATPSRFYPYSVFVDELSYTTAGALAAALAGGGAGGGGAGGGAGVAAATAAGPLYGIASTYIRSPQRVNASGGAAAAAGVQFRITCSFCSLHLDGLLLHETMDPASPATGPTTTRTSPCVTLDPWVGTAAAAAAAGAAATGAAAASASTTHLLQLRFAVAGPVAAAVLSVQWAACNATASAATAAAAAASSGTPPSGPGSALQVFGPLAPLMASPLWYRAPANTTAAAATGAVGVNGSATTGPAMQCDVWPSSAVAAPPAGSVAVLPRSAEVPPALSFRLPHPNASTIPCPGPVGSFCPAGRSIMLRLADVAPAGLFGPSDRLFVRCWSWWGRGFSGGLLAVRSATSLNTAVYLAGQRVFFSVDQQYGDASNRQPSAPNATSLTPAPANTTTNATNGGNAGGGGGSYRQLLAFEWHGVTPLARLSAVEGSTNTSFLLPSMQMDNMLAPAQLPTTATAAASNATASQAAGGALAG